MGQPGIMWYNYRQFEFRLLIYAVSYGLGAFHARLVMEEERGF